MRDPKERPAAIDASIARRFERLSKDDTWSDRYLKCEHILEPKLARPRQKFESTARFCRDLIAERWVATRQARERDNPKRLYYLSMEFLIGRSLNNNLINMAAHPLVEQIMRREGWSLEEVLEEEPDAGLGNGGLGRLAACFIESLATLQYPAMGYGLRYQYGIFRQAIRDGYQVEEPDGWLRRPDPWEIVRPGIVYPVQVQASFQLTGDSFVITPNRPTTVMGIAYDRPVVGYGARCVNTLRLWGAAAQEHFDFAEFSQGEFVGAVIKNVAAGSLTRVLYPDDSTLSGRNLRFLQQYFLVSCSLQDILARYKKSNPTWSNLPLHVAIQMNDTHPSLTVAELMRILMDKEKLGWEEAWGLTVRTLAYTNHTLLPEALERWPVELFEVLLPRHLEIIYEINRRFLRDVRSRYPKDEDRAKRMSLIEEGPVRKVRMAHLAVVGSHSVNGVAEIHSDLLKKNLLRDFAELFPTRLNNKTNGVTPRRWLLMANPMLSKVITDAIGDRWITDLSELGALKKLAKDRGLQQQFIQAKVAAKNRFVDWLKAATGQVANPDMIFDCQIKRVHEYKRQLLNVLNIVVLYNRLRRTPTLQVAPRTFFFAGKAAPAYRLAKLIIKLINSVAATLDQDPISRSRLRVIFLPDYNVTLAERLIPASDVSEQISTAGFEASGTGNMKFMMNGALTIGTRDGATIEMAREAGEENFFLFGLTADEVAGSRAWYNPRWHYDNEPETREAIDLILSDHFNRKEPGIFASLRDTLLSGDYYMHLADLKSYSEAQTRVGQLYADRNGWAEKALINVASSGKFSSDRTITEYAKEIWGMEPSPV